MRTPIATIVIGGLLLAGCGHGTSAQQPSDPPRGSTAPVSHADVEPVALPSAEVLREPYEPLFAGMPRPAGDEPVVATASRLEGLGTFVVPDEPLPLVRPAAVQNAASDATFTVTVRNHDTGEVVAELTPGRGAGFVEGPRTGPLETRYVIEATLVDGDHTVTWTDVAVVHGPGIAVDVELAVAAVAEAPVEFALVNRAAWAVSHGAGYRLDQLVDGLWTEIENPPVPAAELILGPASLSSTFKTGPLPGPGTYRITTEVQVADDTVRTWIPGFRDVAVEFTTQGAPVPPAAPDGMRVTGTLQPPTEDQPSWAIELDPHQITDVDLAYLELDDDTPVTCQDGSTASQADMRSGQDATVTYTTVLESDPPYLVANELAIDCGD